MSIVVSYSEVSKRDGCARQYYYRYVKGLQPVSETLPISTGKKGHKLLQTFYTLMQQGKTLDAAWAIVNRQATDMLLQSPTTDVEAVSKAWTLVDNYIKGYKVTKSESLLVENRFQVPASRFSDDPVFNDVMIGFTPDLVTQRMGGFCDVEDAKFVGKAWSDAKLDQYQQLKLYEIFLKEMGYNISRTILRFFNTATGKIVEHKFVMEKTERDTILEEFLIAVADTVRFKNLPVEEIVRLSRRTLNTNDCQFCSYKFPCSLERKGKSAENTFKTDYIASEYDYNR